MAFTGRSISGVVSIVFVGIAYVIGCIAMGRYSVPIVLLELIITVLALIVIGKGYCSKCPSRENCNHIIFGKISTLSAKYNPGHYTIVDWITLAVPGVAVIVLPQFWLSKNYTLLVLYWMSISMGGTIAVLFCCAQCKNLKCAMCRKKKA